MTTHVTIGEFARLTHRSVKTFHHYHQVGLLEPARVVTGSGYRGTPWDQVPEAHLIRRLRALDMPLAEVRVLLRSRDMRPATRICKTTWRACRTSWPGSSRWWLRSGRCSSTHLYLTWSTGRCRRGGSGGHRVRPHVGGAGRGDVLARLLRGPARRRGGVRAGAAACSSRQRA